MLLDNVIVGDNVTSVDGREPAAHQGATMDITIRNARIGSYSQFLATFGDGTTSVVMAHNEAHAGQRLWRDGRVAKTLALTFTDADVAAHAARQRKAYDAFREATE